MLQLTKYLKAYRKQVIAGPIFKLVEAGFELILPIIMARLIDIGVENRDTGFIFAMGGLMLLLSAAGYVSALVCQYYASIASQGFGTALRDELFAHIGQLSYAELDKFGSSSLCNRITNDVNQLQLAVAMFIRLAIRAPFLCIGAFISAFLIDAKLSLIMVVAIPVFVVVLTWIMVHAVRLYQKVQERLDKLALVVSDNLSGVRIIRAFARGAGENRRFDTANSEHTRAAYVVGKLAALSNPATTLIMNLAVLAILWFGGIRVEAGDMTQGEIIAFISYMSQILLALIVVANLVVLFTKAIASAGRIQEVLSTEPSVQDIAQPCALNAEDTSIAFRDVHFSYSSGSEPALEGISFTLKAGQTAGIIGLTGSGKSTLINLIPRFYDVTGGEILIGGVNVRELAQEQLRSSIAIVPQKSVLFSGDVASNLRFGNEFATDEELAQAAKTAQAEEFIEKLPGGYKAHIERGGANLSGGQRQRLAIARALVKHPGILILDDASSALDFATEARLRHALQEISGMTVLIVSQRASSVRYANQIIVLDDGKIAAVGTHEELLQSCRIYADICRSQEEQGVAQ